MVTVKINGKEMTVEDGTLILDAARSAGHEIPTFCYQADLMGIGSCRMCLVEIEGQKKLQPSCVTPVLHGMSILTDTPQVATARAGVLEFLLANHALDCPVCDKGGECELQDAVHKHGPRHGRHAEKKFKFHEKDYMLSPVIVKNSNRCVQCQKCVRVCREVVGANVLGSMNRGDHQEETSFLRRFLDCDHDGNCIEVCPVGCFMRLPYRYKARPWDLKGADSVCPYCATGCRILIEERDGVVMRSKARLGVGINSETLCARGRFGFDFVNNKDRLKAPLLRKLGRLVPVAWDEAIAAIKDNLGSLVPTRVGGVASARLTNEELYLFQRLMRNSIGTANIDSSSRWDADAVSAFVQATAMNEGGVSVYDCLNADALIIIGSYLTEENPVVDYIVRRISASGRPRVIIASPRAMRLDSSAAVVLRHEPSGERSVLDAIALKLHQANAGRLSQVKDIKTVIDRGLDALLKDSGVDAGALEKAGRIINGAGTVAIFPGTGFLRHLQGISGLGLMRDALSALNKKPLVMPLLDRCNQRGAWEMGAHPRFGPGYSPAEGHGLGSWDMLEAASRREFDALYLAGDDIISSSPDPEFALNAISKVEFLVVQDIFMSKTAERAHVVLPGASFAEKDGTFTNQEGRVQLIKRLLRPPGNAKSDLEIFGSLIHVFANLPAGKANAGAVFEEIRNEIPAYRKVSLFFNNKRNNNNMLDIKDALVNGFEGRPMAAIAPENAPERDGSYPFRLMAGNALFHSGSLSGMSETLTTLMREPFIELSEEDAAEMGASPCDMVIVKGAHFEACLELKIRKGTMKGVAFVPENFPRAGINRFFKKGGTIACVRITKA
ncbi:MAG: NADH-quinone oxidoreductase subunit NuoG [Deltaproteobacteria bacterium]|nr:NADH-quinone oxidoreductase subunit NuoG [Deltaproteobacteria bacterium]